MMIDVDVNLIGLWSHAVALRYHRADHTCSTLNRVIRLLICGRAVNGQPRGVE